MQGAFEFEQWTSDEASRIRKIGIFTTRGGKPTWLIGQQIGHLIISVASSCFGVQVPKKVGRVCLSCRFFFSIDVAVRRKHRLSHCCHWLAICMCFFTPIPEVAPAIFSISHPTFPRTQHTSFSSVFRCFNFEPKAYQTHMQDRPPLIVPQQNQCFAYTWLASPKNRGLKQTTG